MPAARSGDTTVLNDGSLATRETIEALVAADLAARAAAAHPRSARQFPHSGAGSSSSQATTRSWSMNRAQVIGVPSKSGSRIVRSAP